MDVLQVRVGSLDVFINANHIVCFTYVESAEVATLRIFTTNAQEEEYFEIKDAQAKALYKRLTNNQV